MEPKSWFSSAAGNKGIEDKFVSEAAAVLTGAEMSDKAENRMKRRIAAFSCIILNQMEWNFIHSTTAEMSCRPG